MKKVILIGYMGSGKSIIAEELSKACAVEYVELDNLIEENTTKSISELFETKGALFFRKLENKLFKEVISNPKNVIISTGGGTPCYFDNHKLLNDEQVISIYLKASVDTLYHRLLSQKAHRPVVANLSNEDMKEFIAKHIFERSYFYNHAQHTISVDDKTVGQIVTEIKTLLL